jgi:hypothetical protein
MFKSSRFLRGEQTPSATSSESSVEAGPARSRSSWLRSARKNLGFGGSSRQPQSESGGDAQFLALAPRAVDAGSAQRRVSPGRAVRAASISPAHLAAYARVLGAELPADRALLPLVIQMFSDPLPDGWLHGEDDTGARVYKHQRKQRPQYAHPNEQAHQLLLCERKYGRGYVANCMSQLLPSPELDALRALPADELNELAVRFGAFDRSSVGLVTLDDFVATVRRLGSHDGPQLSVRQIRALWERLDPAMLGVVDLANFAAAQAEVPPDAVQPVRLASRRASADGARDEPRAVAEQARARAPPSPARGGRRGSTPSPMATSGRGRVASVPRRGSLDSLEAGFAYVAKPRSPSARAVGDSYGASLPRGARSRRGSSASESDGGGGSRRGSASSVVSTGSQQHIAIDIHPAASRIDAAQPPRGPPTPTSLSADWARLQLDALTQRALAAQRTPLEAQGGRATEQHKVRVAPLHPERRRDLLDAVERGRQRTVGRARSASFAGAREGARRAVQEYLSELRTNSEASNDSKRSSVGDSHEPAPVLEACAESAGSRERADSNGGGGAHSAPSARDERRWAAGSLEAVFEQQPGIGLRITRRSARASTGSQDGEGSFQRQRPPLARLNSKLTIDVVDDELTA